MTRPAGAEITSYVGAVASIVALLTLTDIGVIIGIVTAIATFWHNRNYSSRRTGGSSVSTKCACACWRGAPMSNKSRIAVAALTLSLAGFASWQASEGLALVAMVPTKGDVPTIGHGSTRYENGSKVRMGDRIMPARASVLARNLMTADEKMFAASLRGAKLHQGEFDARMDFVGQFGIGNWRSSSMRKGVLAGNYVAACHALP